MHHRVDSGGLGVEGEPEDRQPPVRGPGGNSSPVTGGEVFGEGGEKDVPPLVPGALRLVDQQRRTFGGRLVSVLLQQLGDELPTVPVVVRRSQVPGKVDQSHRPIGGR